MIGTLHAHKMRIFLGLVFIIVFIASANADSGSFFIDELESANSSSLLVTCGAINGSSLAENYLPFYIGVNESSVLSVFAVNSTGNKIDNENNMVQASFDNVTWYNMTYDESAMSFDIYATSNETENATIYFHFSSSTYNCFNDTFTFKSRVPFYVDVSVYSFDNDSNKATLYENEFNYVYLKYVPDTNASNLSRYIPTDAQMDRFFSKMYGWIPGADVFFDSDGVDREIVFWSEYTKGQSNVKLYETGVYDIYLLSHDGDGLSWNYEFYKPQQFDSVIDNKIKSVNLSEIADYSIDLLATDWEIDSFGVMFNWMKIVVYIVLLLLGISLLTFLPGMAKVLGFALPGLIFLILKLGGFI